MSIAKFAARSFLATATIAAVGIAVPQAQAAPTPAVKLSDRADADTRAFAAAHPGAVRAALVVCGANYVLENAERLPSSDNRLATLFTYRIPGNIPNDEPTCAILDNNTASTKWMKLKLCSNWIADGCAEDVGNFTSYAGPVYRARGGCGKVYAIMKNSAGSGSALVDAIRNATNCD
ncbi:hypothetical protein [Embleya sp. NPDC050493]